MRIDKLNGLWKDNYLYGDSYPAEYQQRVEPFTVDMKFDGNNFTGTCNDFFSDSLLQ